MPSWARMSNLTDKKILITGGRGFLGSRIVNQLRDKGCKRIYRPTSNNYDLRNLDDVVTILTGVEPDIVIHCAAQAGGIGLNQDKPADLFYNNVLMGINLIHS